MNVIGPTAAVAAPHSRVIAAKAPVYCIDPKPVRSSYRPDLIHIQAGAVAGMRDLYTRLTEGR